MAETNIKVEGHATPFSCLTDDEWTVNEAENKIREEYGLINGGIRRNGKATKPTHKIQGGVGVAYVFVGGEKKQRFPEQASSVYLSPRLGGSVFVLAFIRPDEFPIPLGTAWVINSLSMQLLATACHCLNPAMGFEAIQHHLFIVKSIIMNDDGTITYEDIDPISVEAINGDQVSDIAVLRANTPFSEGISLCPLNKFPSAKNENVVKTYHVPCQSFPTDMPILSSCPTGYRKVLMESKHHYFIAGEHMHGSSGGVVVDIHGRAVALICSGYIPGIKLPLPDSFQTLWETVSAPSEGRGTYTRCVKFNVVPALYTFCLEN